MVVLLPAAAIVGLASRCIETVAVDGGHDPLLIVHWKIFTPTPKPVKPVFGNVGEVINPVPEINVQLPVPTAGILPPIVATVAQTVWLTPALASVGFASCVIDIVEVVEGQTPLLIVHLKISTPTPNAVKPVVSSVGVVIVPVPPINVQLPVPIAAVFAAIVAVVLAQIVCEGPAFAIVGTAFTIIAIVAVDGGQEPLITVHAKIFVPTPKAVKPVVANVGVVINPTPETNVQLPVPTAGTLPAMVAIGDEAQIVWLGPALDNDGLLSL